MFQTVYYISVLLKSSLLGGGFLLWSPVISKRPVHLIMGPPEARYCCLAR